MFNEALVTNGRKTRIVFDADQYMRLNLTGTVPLPPTMPEPGAIELAESPDHCGRIVCITQRDSPMRIIRRFVRLEDIRAVAAAGADGQVDCSDLHRFIPADALLSRLEEGQCPLLGVAFVNEQAQMFVQFETTMAACESISTLRFASMQRSSIPSCDPCCDV